MGKIKLNYTRKELIEICERASVKQSLWHDRDSSSAQMKTGECLAMLKAGCTFTVLNNDPNCNTDEETIWIEIKYKGFQTFEYEYESEIENETYYLPTKKRLDEVDGQDWY